MKQRTLLLLTLALCTQLAFASRETNNLSNLVDTINLSKDTTNISPRWVIGGKENILFTQAAFSNWQGGGEAYMGGLGNFSIFATRISKASTWQNKIEIEYGSNYQKSLDRPVKTADQIDIITDFQKNINKKWSLRTTLNFKTQFSPGYKDEKDTIKRSDFMAPGYILNNNGISYQPIKGFSIQASPLSSKITIVNSQFLADKGEYGVKAAVKDANGNIIEHGKNIKYQFGGNIKVVYTTVIMKNIELFSELNLFSNYLEEAKNVDVDWKTKIDFKFNKYFSTTVIAHLIYDDNIAPITQFKEVLGVGFNYSF